MRCDAIIPQTDRFIIPLNPHLNILTLRDVFEEQLEQGIRFLIFETDDLFGEAGVYEEGFLAGCLNRIG
jgi:hypothetical protein